MDTSKAEAILVELLNKTISAVENGAEWIAGEIPDVVQQLLTWHFVEAIVLSLLAGTFIAVVAFFTPSAFREMRKRDDEADATKIIPWIFGSGVSVIVGLPVFITNLLTALKIWVAPKLYLLEYASSLIK